MIRKSHLSVALASIALLAGSQAFACSTSLWGAGLTGGAGGAQSAVGGVIAGQPNGLGGGTAKRYSGLCGLSASAAGAMVQDGTPVAEATYIARFYAHVNMTSGTPVIFNAAEGAPGSATSVYSIRYDFANQRFQAVNRLGVVSDIGAASSAPNNKFYHVHTSWDRSTNGLAVTITTPFVGAVPMPPTPAFNTVSVNLTGFSSSGAAAGPDFAQLGWVSGAGVGAINVDAFESRRTTAIPRLCRADSNASGNISPADRSAITAELGGTALATGQPDCNEDGTVSPADRSCVTALLATGRNACDLSW